MEPWNEIIIHELLPIVGSITVMLLTGLIMVLYNRFKKVKDTLRGFQQMYELMDRVLNNTNVDAVRIMKTHNDGGILHPAHQIYVSIIHEQCDPPALPAKEKYQRIELDGDYIKMLDELIREKNVYLNVSEMPDSFLYRAYKSMGVTYSRIYYLGHTRKEIYYVSFATCSDRPLTAAGDMDTIYTAVSVFRNIFKKL